MQEFVSKAVVWAIGKENQRLKIDSLLTSAEHSQYRDKIGGIAMKLKFPKNVEALIQAKAAAGGFATVEAYILSQLDIKEELQSSSAISQEQWLQKFDAFIASQISRNPHFDDSRESIYPVR